MLSAPSSSAVERWLLGKIVGAPGQAPIRMVLRGDVAVAPPDTLPIATVTIRDYSTLVNLIFNPEVGFGDGYAEGAIEVDGDLVEFLEAAYRSWLLEHVGLSHYGEMGAVIHRSIGTTGRELLHFIGRNHPAPLSAWIKKRIFSGAYTPTLRQAMEVFEPWDISVCDVENLRLHYAKTLGHWLERFERSAQQISRMFDPKFVRTWRFYLAGSLAAFRVGTLQLFQITFAGPQCQLVPWTRAHLYPIEQPQQPDERWMNVVS